MTDKEQQRVDLGRVTIAPDRGRVGQWGTWTVRFVVGAAGIRSGGGIQVALPERWHQWQRNAGRRLQATEPGEPFYVSAASSRASVRLRCEVQEQKPFRGEGNDYAKLGRTNLNGSIRRYAWVVRVSVVEGELAPGDSIDVRYGDRSGGSRGYTPPLYTGSPEQVRATVDAQGSGRFVPLADDVLPWLHTEPGEPVELTVVLPSCTVVGEPAEALLVALDAQQNSVWQAGLQVSVRVVAGEADLLSADGSPCAAREVTLDNATRWGSVRLPFIPRATGLIRLRGQSPDGRLFAVSNPSRCSARSPAERLYWGDLHSHSHFSWDGTGARDDHFRYARDVAGLDVYANTDHGESLSPQDWEQIVAYTAQHDEPGRFVTLVAYEDSFGYPYQHHNVYYRGDDGVMIHSRQMTLPQFWAQASPGDVLTLPHHTAALGEPGRVGIDWSIRDDRFRKAAEIYSSHGQSEASMPEHALDADIVDFTFAGPNDPPSYVRDGWMTGQRLGVLCSSDNHHSHPGVDGYGLMGVYAPELTRAAVYEAIARRRTFGTTGARLLLDFAINSTPMGGECRRPPGTPVQVTATVIGTGPLRMVEVVRGDLERQEWQVMHREWFSGRDAPTQVEVDWQDGEPPPRALYYLRVRQRDLVHGRIVMAWSSPIWIDVDEGQRTRSAPVVR